MFGLRWGKHMLPVYGLIIHNTIIIIIIIIIYFCHFGGFQAFGGVPGEDFDMQNPNLRSKMMENSPQR